MPDPIDFDPSEHLRRPGQSGDFKTYRDSLMERLRSAAEAGDEQALAELIRETGEVLKALGHDPERVLQEGRAGLNPDALKVSPPEPN